MKMLHSPSKLNIFITNFGFRTEIAVFRIEIVEFRFGIAAFRKEIIDFAFDNLALCIKATRARLLLWALNTRT